MIVLDVNVLAYLQSLGLLSRLEDVFQLVAGGHVPWEVFKQVKRSGALGDRLDQWIEEGLVEQHNIKLSGPVGKLVAKILKSRDAGLVGKDLADIQCVALARSLQRRGSTAVLTCERGLPRLCDRRGVEHVDLFDILSLLFCNGRLDAEALETKLEPWSKKDAGNGRPADYAGSFRVTFEARYANGGCDTVNRLLAGEID